MLRLLHHAVALTCSVLAAGEPLPTIPSEYTAVIVVRMPYIPLTMPLRVVTSASAQRIEYFDGLEVDTSSAEGTYKFTFNNSRRVCLFSPPSAGPMLQAAAWIPTEFLPTDLSKYTDEGEEVVDGILCRKFTLSVKHGTTGSMDDRIIFYWDAIMNKPKRWYMHARAIPFGSHTDEYFMDYLSFQEDSPLALDLEPPDLCKMAPKASTVSVQIKNFLKAATTLKMQAGDMQFEHFLQQNGKSYGAEEHAARKSIFEKNVLLVDELNKKHAGQTTFKASRSMDMTKEEIMTFRGGKSKGTSRQDRRLPEHKQFVSQFQKTKMTDAPKDFDWRTHMPGVVSPVKDQAMCGSCWTYGVTEPIESALAIQSKKPVVILPEQYVLDCTWTNNTGSSHKNNGCDGGDSDIGALEIVRKFGGIVPTAEAYGSYLSTNGYCKDISNMAVGAKITGWVDLGLRDQDAVMQALMTQGPLSIGIQVPEEMLYYDTGVLNVPTCKNNVTAIDHAVTLVGFGEQSGSPYHLVRNSWSTYWGDNGYIKIVRGDNDCCVSCQAGYPQLSVSEETRTATVVNV